jgi:NAD(P)-dependent dehydrogenase (short-subunit alcohol dehydrogenase family)
MNNPFDLGKRVVVVTGGLGKIGWSVSTALAKSGGRVAILDKKTEGFRESIVSKRSNSNISLVLNVDVTKREEVDQSLHRIQVELGEPYGLINIAALDSPPDLEADDTGPLETYSELAWDAVMNVNTKGVLIPCQVFGGRMAKSNGGSIVNVSSIYGLVSPDQGIYQYRKAQGKEFFKPIAYSASKSALFNLTRYMATYWGKKGVRVNTLTLGGVFDGQDSQFLESYCKKVPMGRMARPGEYDGLMVFMMSDASSYITGANLVADGGWTAW